MVVQKVIYKKLCDPTSLQTPTKQYLVSVLDKAHGSILGTNYSNMQTFFQIIISMLEDFAKSSAKMQTVGTRIQSSIYVPDHAKPALLEQMDAQLNTRAISTTPLPTARSSDSSNKKRRRSDDSPSSEHPPYSGYTTSTNLVPTNSTSTNSSRIPRKTTSRSLVSSRDTNNVIIVNTDATRTLSKALNQI